MGFVASRRNQHRGSLCRITTPTPSALGVSHSLSGFIPSTPRGFVSRHFRPQASGLQSFSRATSRNASRRPLLSCRSRVVISLDRSRSSDFAATSEPCSNRTVDTRRGVISASPSRCSLDLSPLRGLPIPVTGPKPLPSRASSPTQHLQAGSVRVVHLRVCHPSLEPTTRVDSASMGFFTSSRHRPASSTCKQVNSTDTSALPITERTNKPWARIPTHDSDHSACQDDHFL
jgi:hypothetical protein